MRKVIILILIIMTSNIFAQKPETIRGYKFDFPDYEIKSTSNNIQVILIEDDEQPITNVRLIIGGGSSTENKPGIAELTASMLTKGARDYSAQQIAQIIDGNGAILSTRAAEDMLIISLQVLNKNLNNVLPVFEAIVNTPTFNEDELEKLKSLSKAAIIADKSNPASLASKLSKVAIYGENHPYSQFTRENDIDNITPKDLKEYYSKHLNARNISIAIFGDYSSEAKDNILATIVNIDDDKEKTPIINLPEPVLMPQGVYFIPREGSVQSSIRVLFPTPAYKDFDYELISMNGTVIGASFTGRLFKTLREKYSYTYSPSGGVTARKFDNFFYAAADVNESVTDSSINVIKDQVLSLATENVNEDELNSIKKYKTGSYYMNFENSSYVASLIQNAEFKGKKAKTLETYDDRMKGFTPTQLNLIAKKYLKPEFMRIVVVGPESVKDKLTQFGKVYEYDKNIKANTGYAKVDIDAEDLLEEYLDAIGDDIEDLEYLEITGTGKTEMNGNSIETSLLEYRERKGKFYQSIDFAGMTQKKMSNGEKAWIIAGGVNQEVPVDETMALEADFFGVRNLIENGFNCKVLGKKDGKIYMKAEQPNGSSSIYQFDASTYLLLSASTVEEAFGQKIEVETFYSDYKKHGDFTLPAKIKNSSPMMNMNLDLDYKFDIKNSEISFTPEK